MAFLTDQPCPQANMRQPQIGIVLPEQEAVFAARGHHAIRFRRSLGHKIINQRADIGFAAVQHHAFAAQQLTGGIDSRHQPLRSRLFITGTAVKLACSVKPRHRLTLQSRVKLRRIHAVILNGIGRAHHFRLLQPRHGVQHGKLDILRHGGRHSLNV